MPVGAGCESLVSLSVSFERCHRRWGMPDRFSNALLAALNESAEVRDSDWNSIADVLRAPISATCSRPQMSIDAPFSENRFAATIGSCMARVRDGR
jgi:hypothetical protein